MDKKIYEDQYDFELNQRAYFASAVNIPIVAITILGSAIASMGVGYIYGINASSIIFIMSLSLSTLSLAVSVFFIFNSLIGYVYKKLQPPSQLKRVYTELTEWHIENNGSDEGVNRDFENELCERLGQAIEVNSKNNITRGNFLYAATISLAVATIFLGLSGFLYVLNKVENSSTPQKIEIIGKVETK